MKRKRWDSNLVQRKDTGSSKHNNPFLQMPPTRPKSQVDESFAPVRSGARSGLSSPSPLEHGIGRDESSMLPNSPDNGNMVDVEQMEPPVEEIIGTVQEVQDSGGAGQDLRLLPLKWSTITSLLAMTGTKRFSEEAYEMFSVFLNWLSRDPNLPSTSMMKKTIRPSARAHTFVKTQIRTFSVDFAKSGARSGVGTFLSKKTAPVMIVKPIDWAKMDLAAHSVQKLLRNNQDNEDTHVNGGPFPCFRTIEDAPIFKSRSEVLERFRICNTTGGSSAIKEGLLLKVKAKDSPSARRSTRQSGLQGETDQEDGVVSFCGRVHSKFIATFLDKDLESDPEDDEDEARGTSIRLKGKKVRKKKRMVSNVESVPFRAGDLVVRLEPVSVFRRENEMWSSLNAYIVFRAWNRANIGMKSDFRISIVFLRSGQRAERWSHGQEFIRELVHEVIAEGEQMFVGVDEDSTGNRAPPEGRLSDGRRYIVYRFFLYSDGFTPHVGKKGNIGGCYMMPLGIFLDDRKTVGAIRRLGLTPPGVSTNEVLAFFIEDIVKGTVEGFVTKDSDGNEVVMFLDCVGFIADYPAISETIDVLVHTSNVPCHLCYFARYDKSGRGGSAYGYTTDIPSDHPAFSRNEERLRVLRNTRIAKEDLRRLGMESTEEFEASLNALHRLSRSLEEIRNKVPRSLEGIPVVPAVFDAYRSCVIAPDHLFLGLAQDVINCTLKHVPVQVRRDAEEFAKESLASGDLVYQNRLVNIEAMEVYSMSISAMYSFLLIAPHAFKSAGKSYCTTNGTEQSEGDFVEQCLGLLQDFQELVTRTQYHPVACIDGPQAVHEYNESGGMKRLYSLKKRPNNYVQNLSALCRGSEKAKKTLDKPNVHRLLEFYAFTLPAFGSARFIQEFVLEKAHQDMKRGVMKSNYKNSQLQAMEHAIANDWANRLGIELEEVGQDRSDWTKETYTSVLRLHGHPEWCSPTSERLRNQVEAAFPEPVLHVLRTRRKAMSSLISSSKSWEASKGIETNLDEVDCHKDAKEFLQKYADVDTNISSNTVDRGCVVTEHREARWVVTYGKTGALKRTSMRVVPGDVVQSVTCNSEEELLRVEEFFVDIALPMGSSDARRTFSMIAAIFLVNQRDNADAGRLSQKNQVELYALVAACKKVGPGMFSVDTGTPRRTLIPLNRNVRRAIALHNCVREATDICACSVGGDDGGVQHRPKLEEGGTYQIYSRYEGYPPRSA